MKNAILITIKEAKKINNDNSSEVEHGAFCDQSCESQFEKKVAKAQEWWDSLSFEQKQAEIKKLDEEWIKKALEELQIQDSSLSLESINSPLLGLDFRCGFLGLLHQEIIQERLRTEYQCEIITTPPALLIG